MLIVDIEERICAYSEYGDRICAYSGYRGENRCFQWIQRIGQVLIVGIKYICLQLSYLKQIQKVGQMYKSTQIYPSIHLIIYRSIHLSTYSSIHLSIYPSIHLSIYPSIQSLIHMIHAVTQLNLVLVRYSTARLRSYNYH